MGRIYAPEMFRIIPSSSRGPLFAIAMLMSLSPLFGQVTGGELVYRFTVQDVQDRVAAKPVQYALMEYPFAASISFIEECACFKLAVHTAIDYAALSQALQQEGYVLTGDVLLSNGSVLHPPHAIPDEQ